MNKMKPEEMWTKLNVITGAIAEAQSYRYRASLDCRIGERCGNDKEVKAAIERMDIQDKKLAGLNEILAEVTKEAEKGENAQNTVKMKLIP